jgi:sugar phosphate isomerase/epimerase
MAGYDPYSEDVLASIAEQGYDGVEVPGANMQIKDPVALRKKIEGYGLEIAAVTGLWGWAGGELGAVAEKDIMSSNPVWRQNAVQYIKDCVDLMVALGGKCDTSAKGKAHARENLLQTMREALPYANQNNVNLPLEPNNRYEGYPFFMRTLAEAKEIVEELRTDCSGIVADTFHMNIEETKSIPVALMEAGTHIRHIHCVDNNRLGVGMGSIDFKPIFAALKVMGYQGYLTVESCPPQIDPKVIASVAIQNMKALE